MAKQTFKIAVGDTLKTLRAYLKQKNEEGTTVPVDLTGKTVKFKMILAKDPYTVVIDEVAAVVDNATTGLVHFEFSSGQVNTAGVYDGHFIVIDGGAREHFPPDQGLTVNIYPADGTKLSG